MLISADKIMDSVVGLSGFVKDLTGTELDDLAHAGALACRNDPAFMSLLRRQLEGPSPQALGDGSVLKMLLAWLQQLLDRLLSNAKPQAQAFDFATIMKIIAAIKTIIDLISQLKGGGLPLPNAAYNPSTENRCI